MAWIAHFSGFSDSFLATNSFILYFNALYNDVLNLN